MSTLYCFNMFKNFKFFKLNKDRCFLLYFLFNNKCIYERDYVNCSISASKVRY